MLSGILAWHQQTQCLRNPLHSNPPPTAPSGSSHGQAAQHLRAKLHLLCLKAKQIEHTGHHAHTRTLAYIYIYIYGACSTLFLRLFMPVLISMASADQELMSTPHYCKLQHCYLQDHPSHHFPFRPRRSSWEIARVGIKYT